jgi:hypothetical protein
LAPGLLNGWNICLIQNVIHKWNNISKCKITVSSKSKWNIIAWYQDPCCHLAAEIGSWYTLIALPRSHGVSVIEHFCSSLLVKQNKLERLFVHCNFFQANLVFVGKVILLYWASLYSVLRFITIMQSVIMLSVVAPDKNGPNIYSIWSLVNCYWNYRKSQRQLALNKKGKYCQFLKKFGLYYKNITILKDTSRVVRMTIVSDTTTRIITYGSQLHS